METHWIVTVLVLFLESALVSSRSLTDERSVNFLREWTSDIPQRYEHHLLRLRRSNQETTTPSPITSKFHVGRCPFVDFLRSTQNCSKTFYDRIRLRDNVRNQCKNEYADMRSCMLETLTNCIEEYSEKVNKIKKNFLIILGDQNFWCKKGGIGVSSDLLPTGFNCDPVFYHVSEGCTSTYRKIFREDTNSSRLCKEYERAKMCYIETLFRHCSFDKRISRAVQTMIQISDDLQPFCSRPIAQEEAILDRVMFSKECPSYSLADVAFALDVSNSTDKKQYISMKRIIEKIVKRMDYGSRGIQIAVFQYDAETRNILKFGRPAVKTTVQWRVRRMKRTTLKSAKGANRMTGRALRSMGKSTFYRRKTGKLVKKLHKSGQRPHNPAVLFVMTTGTSSDPMGPGLEVLNDRNVRVVFAGPPTAHTTSQQPRKDVGSIAGPLPPDINTGESVYKTVITDFKLREVNSVVEKMVNEICASDRQQQAWANTEIVERPTEGSRFFDYDLLQHFELNLIVPAAVTSPPVQRGVPRGNVPFSSIYEGVLSGDIFMTGQIPTNDPPSSRWPFYMSEKEYMMEAAFENSLFTK